MVDFHLVKSCGRNYKKNQNKTRLLERNLLLNAAHTIYITINYACTIY